MIDHPAFQKSLDELKAVGFETCSASESGAVPYAVVGGRSNARWWLIPLTNRKVTVAGFALFQPISLSARLIKGLTIWASLLGFSFLWVKKRVYLKNSNDFFKSVFACDDLQFALFTGTDSPHRKSAVQIMDRTGKILGFAKVSANPLIVPLLRHEAKTLNYVNTLDLKTALVPKVLFCDEVGPAQVLVTDSLKTPRSKTVTRLTDAHYDFLRELAEKMVSSSANSNGWYVAGLRKQYNAVADSLSVEWQQRFVKAFDAIEESKVDLRPRKLSHGDFTPWNTFFVGDKLYVFDWEYASEQYQKGHDLIHFTLSPPSEKGQSISDKIVDVRKTLCESGMAEDDKTSDIFFLCYLCGHSLHYIIRNVGWGKEKMTWDGEHEIAVLLDNLLNKITK